MEPLNGHQSKSNDDDLLGLSRAWTAHRHDRLLCALSSDPAFTLRAPALLAAGVLLFSASATATSVASEPDHQQEGLAAPEQVESAEPLPPGQSTESEGPLEGERPSDDLGQHSGGETPLPFEVDPAPGAPTSEVEPLETEPVDDPDGRLPLADPVPPAPLGPNDGASDGAVPPTAPPAPPAAPVGTPAPPTRAEDPTAIQEVPPADQPADRQPDHPRKRDKARRGSRGDAKPGERSKRRPVLTKRAPVPAPVDSPPASPMAPADVAAQPTSNAPAEPLPSPAGRFHVVRPGESLWSIATALLGPGASSAAIAAELRRLWRLNERRIGTGDPNLLPVGVKLRLR